ncbi:MAG: hypothetical protein LBG80_14260 [Bacteroidales bacterium]|jgi:hypothetical protein|nr:hypothetical protein [Bacteroidales bacterium]
MKNIYLHIIGIMFMIIFSVESFAQACNLPEGQIIASPVYVYDASADSMIITMPVKNLLSRNLRQYIK